MRDFSPSGLVLFMWQGGHYGGVSLVTGSANEIQDCY